MTEKSIVSHVFVLQRNGKSVDKDKGQPVQPFQPERVPVQVPRQEAWVPPRTLYGTPLMDPYLIDGRVIFRVIYVKNVTDTIIIQCNIQGKILWGKYSTDHRNCNITCVFLEC